MNTKFYSLTKRGGQIVFCVTLTLFMSAFSFTASGQFTDANITTGRNYFRDYLSNQVANPVVLVRTYRTDNGTWSTTKSLPVSCTGYAGLINVAANTILWPVTNNSPVNTIEITPTTPNSGTDFRNGVTSVDLLEISKFLNGQRAFNSWHFAAADTDNNSTITLNDRTLIQNLILGISNDYGPSGRKSWSWVPNSELTSFINYPYCCLYGGPFGGESIIFSNLSRNQITNSSAHYFKLHTIKNGDIKGNSGTGSADNTWICGILSYSLTSDIITESRANIEIQNTKVSKGDKVQLAVVLDQKPDTLGALQFGLNLPNEFSVIEKIEFQNGFNPKWHYDKESGNLVVLDYYDVVGEYPIYSVGDIMKIEIKLNKDANLNDVVAWSESFNEVVHFSGETFDVDFNLEIRNIVKSSMDITILNNENLDAIINSPDASSATITVSDISGKILESRNVNLLEGVNHFNSSIQFMPGMYILTVNKSGLAPKSIKFIK